MLSVILSCSSSCVAAAQENVFEMLRYVMHGIMNDLQTGAGSARGTANPGRGLEILPRDRPAASGLIRELSRHANQNTIRELFTRFPAFRPHVACARNPCATGFRQGGIMCTYQGRTGEPGGEC